ncbi:hypothetical protein EV188_101427 [Actinomycetospora succinea]|uniref:Uncharacterized protein n=1 Tax=Actinomycetospora succinea TaxID=663603 RepID=A0A4V3DB47_9PSEU|nr:hypothetical protein [Actinomycetospora succinea]TDQ65178.1 hypothetical protein EV188_101427 [Actinomycetospora succinea]
MSRPEQATDTPRTALPWPAGRHDAYLDSRPDETSRYDPAAEYGDGDWREPASDAEAGARIAYLRDYFPPAPGWPTRPLTPVEDAFQDAQERAVLYRAHDSDPYAWAEYQRLQALDRLAPLPAHDALDGLPRDEHGRPDILAAPAWNDEDRVARDHWTDEAAFDGRDSNEAADNRDGPFTDTQGLWWPSTGAWAAGTCDPNRADASGDLGALDDPERLRRRIETLRASLAADAQESLPEDEQRREQLARWHHDDHRTTDTGDDLDTVQAADDGADGLGEQRWGR